MLWKWLSRHWIKELAEALAAEASIHKGTTLRTKATIQYFVVKRVKIKKTRTGRTQEHFTSKAVKYRRCKQVSLIRRQDAQKQISDVIVHAAKRKTHQEVHAQLLGCTFHESAFTQRAF